MGLCGSRTALCVVYGFLGRVDVSIVGRMDVLRSKEKCNDVRM